MRDISLNAQPAAMPRYTILNYGDTRTGKTHFGATMPRPLIIADVTESGYTTILNMDRNEWFEPNIEPMVIGVENMNDVAQLMPRLDQLIASKRIYSLVFDAFSFYTDFFLNGIIMGMAPDKRDMRRAYGDLGIHLRQIRTSIHSKPISVMWNCLAKHPDTDDPKGRPLIPGQQSDKFSAGVDFLVHSQVEMFKENGKVVRHEHRLRTRAFGSYIVGNRLGATADELPDPFVGNYADFLVALGHDVETIRRSMPKPGASVVAAKPTIVGKPPVVAAKPVISVPPKGAPSASNNQAPRGAVK